MPTIRVPNRSTIALQKNESTGEFGWRNSQPGLFSYDDTNGYRYDTNRTDEMIAFGPSLKLFCKDSVTGEKLWMNSPTGYRNPTGMVIANVNAVRVVYKETDSSGDKDTGWQNTYDPSWDSRSNNYLVSSSSVYWHMLELTNVYIPAFSYYFRVSDGPAGEPRDKISTVSRIDIKLTSYNSGQGPQLAKCLGQGLSYREMLYAHSTGIHDCIGDGYAEVTYEENSDQFTYSFVSVGEDAQSAIKNFLYLVYDSDSPQKNFCRELGCRFYL